MNDKLYAVIGARGLVPGSIGQRSYAEAWLGYARSAKPGTYQLAGPATKDELERAKLSPVERDIEPGSEEFWLTIGPLAMRADVVEAFGGPLLYEEGRRWMITERAGYVSALRVEEASGEIVGEWTAPTIRNH